MKTTRFDAAKYLATPEAQAALLNDAAETGDPASIANARATVERVRLRFGSGYDFRHAAMHRLEDWPVLARIAARQTQAKRLDSRAVASLYARATDADRQAMTDRERAFGQAALTAWPLSEGWE